MEHREGTASLHTFGCVATDQFVAVDQFEQTELWWGAACGWESIALAHRTRMVTGFLEVFGTSRQ